MLLGGVCCLLGLCTCVTSVCQSCCSRIASGIRPDLSLIEDNMKLNVEASLARNSAFACPYQVLMGIYDNFCAATDLIVMLDYLLLPERAFRFAFSSGLSYSGSCGLRKICLHASQN